MSELQIGLLGIGVLFALLASSMPVGFAMTLVGAAGFAAVVNAPAALSLLATDYYDVFSSYGLTVIPLFVFMGQVAFHTGVSKKLFDAAHCWFGWLRGGLAMATVGACTAFGAICGSGPATAATCSPRAGGVMFWLLTTIGVSPSSALGTRMLFIQAPGRFVGRANQSA